MRTEKWWSCPSGPPAREGRRHGLVDLTTR
jgi:hypothetical protein